MKRLGWLALVLAGCGGDADDMFPVSPGGGGGAGGVTRLDAAIDASGDGGGPITGRVCILTTNLRTISSSACATTGGAGLTVTLGDEAVVPAADGSFTIARPTSTADLYWSVTGATIQGTLVGYGSTFGSGSAPLLPAFDRTAYLGMVSANQAAYDDGNAGLVVRVTRAGAPVPNATIGAAPAPVSEVYYDAATDENWDQDSTQTAGVAWIPGIQGNSAQLMVTANSTNTVLSNVVLAPGALTFVAAEIP